MQGKYDDDMTDTTLCGQKREGPYPSHRLLGTSFLSLVTSALAFHVRAYDAAILVFCVFATSVCYWYDPKPGLRRNIDIAAVVTCGVYQTCVIAPISRHRHEYASCILLGMLSYGVSKSMVDTSASAWFHVGVHVLGNIANVILYTGL